MRKIICLCMALLLTFTLSGCAEKVHMKDRIIVQGLGVDFDKEQYKITIQTYKSSSAQEPKNDFEIYSSSGRTISEAISNIDSNIGQKAFFSNIEIIIFSRSCFEEGISAILDFFIRFSQIRKNVSVVCTEKNSAELFEIESDSFMVPANRISKIANSNQSNVNFPESDLISISERYLNDSRDVYIPIMGLKEEDGKKNISFDGILCFEDDYPKGILSNYDTAGFNWIRKYKSEQMIMVQTDKGDYSLSVKSIKSKIITNIENNKPVITVKLYLKCNIEEITSGEDNFIEDDIETLTEALNSQIEQMVKTTVNKAFYEYNSDIFNFGAYVKKQNIKYWKSIDNWSQQKQFSIIKYDINSDIYRAGRQNRSI